MYRRRSILAALDNNSSNVVHRVKNLNIGKTGKNEKPLLPYEMIQDEEGCEVVKFGAGKDKVMEAILENNTDHLKTALQDPLHYNVTNLLRSGETAPMVVSCDRGYTECVQYYRLYHPRDKGDKEGNSGKEDSDEHMRDAEDGIDMSKVPFVLCRNDESDFLYLRLKSGHTDSVMEAVLKGNPDDLLKALEEAKGAGYLRTIDMHRDGQLYPPLVQATISDHQQCVEHLLEYGADVLAYDTGYATAIHAASRFARMEILGMLFHTAKGDKRLTWHMANYATKDGKTPLHYAVEAESKSKEVVNFLLNKGADPQFVDRDMKRPSAFCVDSDTQEMLLRTENEYDKGKRLGV